MTADVRPGEGLRVVVIGAGMIAQVHRRGAVMAGAEVVGVVAGSAQEASAAADRWGVEPLESLSDALDRGVDVVHICTPNVTHAPLARQALDAGVHVVCEKPLGIDLAESRSLHEAARSAGVVATVPFVYRYHPVVREIRARVLDGRLGALSAVHGSYLQDWLLDDSSSNWRVDPRRGGGSRAFADIGSHWFDLVRWVTGQQVTSLAALTSIAVARRPVDGGTAAREPVQTEDIAMVLARTDGDAVVSSSVSQVAAGRKNRLWFEVDGALGSAVFDQENPESAWFGTATGAEVFMRSPSSGSAEQRRLATLPAGHPQGYAQCFESFVADTYRAVRGQHSEGLPTFGDGLRAARLTEAVVRAAATKRWEEVE